MLILWKNWSNIWCLLFVWLIYIIPVITIACLIIIPFCLRDIKSTTTSILFTWNYWVLLRFVYFSYFVGYSPEFHCFTLRQWISIQVFIIDDLASGEFHLLKFHVLKYQPNHLRGVVELVILQRLVMVDVVFPKVVGCLQ